jgi:hypothetical protein
MMLERCSFSKITTTTWSGRGTTAAFLPPAGGTTVPELRGLPAIPVAEVRGTGGVAADRGSAAVHAESPIRSVMATGQPIHPEKALT